MINDVGGQLAAIAGELGVAYIAMHARGNPKTMQEQTTYDDLLGEVTTVLLDRCHTAKEHGATAVYGDPGIGFAKTFEQNRFLLAHLSELASTLAAEGFGLLVGVSRKGFLSEGASGQRYPVEERGDQSLAASVWAMANGAAMVRVHDGLHTVRAAVLVGEVGTI
jgi:dihydropteroate synthase